MSHNYSFEIEITSDFICPWCYVVERRLKQAAKEVGIKIRLSYRPYELNPNMPVEGMNRKIYRTAKFGSWEYSQKLDAGTCEASSADNLSFNYDKIQITPNTRKAHLLVAYTQDNNPTLEANIADEIFEAYFTNGQNIGDEEDLFTIASVHGLDIKGIKRYWSSDTALKKYKTSLNSIQNHISSVPNFAIEQHKFRGAVDKDILVKALEDTLIDKQYEGQNESTYI